VDVAYHGDQQSLRFDFQVAAGANVSQIALSYGGAVSSVDVDQEGRLLLQTPSGQVVQDAPVLYQTDEAGQRQEVTGHYQLREGGTVGFVVDAYDPNRVLVIDPTVFYGSYYGTSGNDYGNALAVDYQGNVYVGGTSGGSAFVAKFEATGKSLL